MNSSEYWKDRFVELKISRFKKIDLFARQLEDLHNRTQKKINDDIILFYKKVATANGISMAEAKKLMSRKDRKEFQWTLEEYQQHAKADLLSGITSSHVMNASANWHLSYLDGMKLQLEHHVDKLYKNIDSKTRNHFKESLNENYLNTAFELQKGIGIGEKMEVPYDERNLENILRTPWASDGKNFSDRIWRDRTQLVNNLQKHLSESVIRGDSDTDMIQVLSIDEDRAKFNTRRLIETESAYFDSLSEQECCEDFGVEKYRFLAVLDMKTSDICQELDNKVFLEKDRQVGVNAPPMHPFCRSTTAPVIDEEFLTSRRAKNPKTGEYDEISPDLSYEEWKQKFVINKEHNQKEKTNKSKNLKVSDERRIKRVKNRIKKSKRKVMLTEKSILLQNNKVDTNYIISDSYRKQCFSVSSKIQEFYFKNFKIEDIFKEWNIDKEKFNNTIYEISKHIFDNVDGTCFENLSIFNTKDLSDSGEYFKIIENNVKDREEEIKKKSVSFSREQDVLSAIWIRQDIPFVTSHCHPFSSPPSPKDFCHFGNFENFSSNKYKIGINFCFNGDIYVYYSPIEEISDEDMESMELYVLDYYKCNMKKSKYIYYREIYNKEEYQKYKIYFDYIPNSNNT